MKIAPLSPEHHVVLWTVHHIVCDGWSNGLLISELAKIYSALRQGVEPTFETRRYRSSSMPRPSPLPLRMRWLTGVAVLPTCRHRWNCPRTAHGHRFAPARASTASHQLDEAFCQLLKRAAAQQRTTMVVLLIAGLKGPIASSDGTDRRRGRSRRCRPVASAEATVWWAIA